MKRLIIVGSPRTEGKSAMLAELLFETCIEECPEDEVFLAPVSTLDVSGCVACDWCRRQAAGELDEDEVVKEDAGASSDDDLAPRHCRVRDDMDDVYPLIDAADELIIVSPVYFAGAPAQLKALLDRFQPYFWTKTRARKRPATLHVVGEGGDPHGFDPLVGSVRSAAAVAGFRLERVLDWVGKIADDGEITEEACEYEVAGSPVRLYAPGRAGSAAGNAFGGEDAGEPFASEQAAIIDFPADAPYTGRKSPKADRPRLSLGDNGSERQVIQLDEDGKRIDDARRGRKRAGDRKHANAKRGTNGVKQAPNRNPHAKGKGADSSRGGSGAAAGGPNKAPGRGASRTGKGKKGNNQGKRRG